MHHRGRVRRAPWIARAWAGSPWNVWPVTARLLWQIITAATAAITGSRFPSDSGVYSPHLSLAYGTGDAGRRAMKVWLSDDLATDPVILPTTRLSLVAQSHDGHTITWRHITGVPLGPARRRIPPGWDRALPATTGAQVASSQ